MTDVLLWLEEAALPSSIREGPHSVWAYPAVLTLHTFGLMVLVGLNAAVDLRLLGAGRQIPVASLTALFPLMWAGFWINVVTGALLFAADATTKAGSAMFLTKLTLVAFGAGILLAIGAEVERAGPVGMDVSRAGRRLAAASLLTWTAAVTAGRLLAYV
ncbi:MAG: hypothetical protein A3F70_03800 [Acidobacteria bacterium RIFCSPLOWO2_12_FULL_67_14]|nr:MAG: hypothetical protein A3H29_14655 [Acidobacteria bacterium RIFCSPLOWO2_02_FULL_67_21]OFW35347.1 MAG: hypothetical protein A3F70_03800 [Acidobacteria bacterium RIFCSPLOWO2_12_FULL_67_14]